ncbi:DUF2254 domain-containing protein [Sinorhizobium sp. BG8]|uniref:DUF2254 domain-containing protein n=1 Tax=Sinorhizobium sp. BG8 TaxID=2613773 RepID=UPI00193E84E8|nr:DUF2254 domain-containing protein [Sinorhizobium sp. BG8]QRM53810.1 DUF2254 domain-containing protein [Sinorhizobium sp. BG8]
MSWNRWYSIKSYVRSTLWLVPFIALLSYVVLIQVLDWINVRYIAMPLWPWGTPGAQRILETIVTLTLTFIVFTFGSLLVAIQVASGQLTPRIIATALLRDNVIRMTVGIFIFTLLFSLGVLGRLEAEAPFFLVGVAGILGFVSLIAFLYLIDHAARLLRPITIVQRLGDLGSDVIETVYPDVFDGRDVPASLPQRLNLPSRTILYHGKSGVILAINLKALVNGAERSEVIIEFTQYVGSFVESGEPLFRLYGDTAKIEKRWLLENVAIGPERTIEQDSTFAFRIIVDIAIKALSKAINDPTTAVLAIDQLNRLLRKVGARRLRVGQRFDKSGQLRLILQKPNWEDFVQLAVREIRYYGAENFQVARRLRAMLENLLQALPEERHPALRAELTLLDDAVKTIHVLPADLALASVADPQGLGAGLSR